MRLLRSFGNRCIYIWERKNKQKSHMKLFFFCAKAEAWMHVLSDHVSVNGLNVRHLTNKFAEVSERIFQWLYFTVCHSACHFENQQSWLPNKWPHVVIALQSNWFHINVESATCYFTPLPLHRVHASQSLGMWTAQQSFTYLKCNTNSLKYWLPTFIQQGSKVHATRN